MRLGQILQSRAHRPDWSCRDWHFQNSMNREKLPAISLEKVFPVNFPSRMAPTVSFISNRSQMEPKDGRNDVVAGISSAKSSKKRRTRPPLHRSEEPTRLFVALGLGEDTNARFRCVTGHQRTARLSTGFDGPTLYGLDSDADGVFGKIGEGGVAIDTVEDMERLYAGF